MLACRSLLRRRRTGGPWTHDGLAAAAAAAAPAAAAAALSRGLATKQQQRKRKKGKGALDVAISQIESMYGPGSLMKLGDEQQAGGASGSISQRWTAADVIPTGSFRLDHALGIGGLPRGRVIEMYGPESCGKTTLALHAVAEAQKAGGVACFIDVEHALDTDYAANLGVDMSELYIAQPQSGEQALEIMDTLVRSGSMDLIVLDSVAALVPRAELEGEMGDVHVGLQARLMSQALRKLTASLATGPRNSGGSGPGGAEVYDEETGEAVREHPPALIFINQLRQKIGVMYGNDEVTAGGHALKYYSSVRCEVRRQMPKGALTMGHTGSGGEAPTANAVTVKVVKNKCAPPFRQAQFAIRFGVGICKLSEVLELAIEAGYIKQGGSWFTLQLPPPTTTAAAAGEGAATTLTSATADEYASGDDDQDDEDEEEEMEPLKFQGMERLRAAVEADPVLFGRLQALVGAYIKPGAGEDREAPEAEKVAGDDGAHAEPLLQSP